MYKTFKRLNRIILSRFFTEFYDCEKRAGILLIVATIFSLSIANSHYGETYIHFWHTNLNGHNIEFWINDGLMAVFFLMVGLEIKRELFIGELSDFRSAILPVVAATGGMIVPASIHLSFNFNTLTQAGAGIPMATDIAFAIAVLSIVGDRVPLSLKIFLTALAIIDDLGAILVIAIFYSTDISFIYLGLAAALFFVLFLFNRFNIKNTFVYITGGVLLWYFMLNSGIHATLAGVLLAFAIPFDKSGEDCVSHRIMHFLHKPVGCLILPVFALANTGIQIGSGWHNSLLSLNSLGIMLGLFIGKPLGIFLFTRLFCSSGVCRLPLDLNWRYITGAGFLGGIGFTMSVFISILAFDQPDLVTNSKIAIFLSSIISGIVGYFILRNISARRIN